MLVLPPGPTEGRLSQTVMLTRDPLGTLRRLRSRFGPVFTIRTTNGPMVVVGDAGELERLTQLDPGSARAGEARRRVLPQAAPRSVFGGDGDAHRAASDRVHPALSPSAVAAVEPELAAIAARHAAAWPTGRPFKLRVRLRDVAAEVWIRLILRPSIEARTRAVRRAARHLLRTPGNPPLPPPGGGVLGAAMTQALERRLGPFGGLVAAELAERRSGGAPHTGGLLDAFAASELTPHEVVDELTIVTAAAIEATASGLTSVLERLAHQRQLAEALAAGGAADPRFGPVVDECLRLRPVAMAAMRRLIRPVTLAGRTLEPGTVVMAPSLLLHRDPSRYAAADDFRPDRFRDGVDGPFFPYGGGARACIGRHLAQAEIRAVVPAVLRARRLRPLARAPERLVERATILTPVRGALVVASSP